MKLFTFIFSMVLFITLTGCSNNSVPAMVLTGLDRVDEYDELFNNKKIGIITNHTAYNIQNQHISKIFNDKENVKIVALFGPEHGVKGNVSAGGEIGDSYDSLNSIPVYSLYGETRKPTKEILKGIDMLVYDIQDVGARYYTYISTMALAMEAAAENNIEFVVLDRPNPINGIDVEGNILEPEFKTFVGMFPTPVRHGMTNGELAKMINEEGWLENGVKANLQVVPMSGWKREMWFDETNLTWRSPSPNIPDFETTIVYPGLCLFEGTNVSEGRGTYQPFSKIGADWFDETSFVNIKDKLNLPVLEMTPISFTPKSIQGMSEDPKFENVEIYGLEFSVKDRNNFHSYISGIELVKYFYELNKEKFEWRESHFDRLCGTDQIRKFIINGVSIDEIRDFINKDMNLFLEKRNKYLIY